MLFFFLLFAASAAHQYLLVPNYQAIEAVLEISDFQIGLVSSTCLITFALSTMVWRYLAKETPHSGVVEKVLSLPLDGGGSGWG